MLESAALILTLSAQQREVGVKTTLAVDREQLPHLEDEEEFVEYAQLESAWDSTLGHEDATWPAGDPSENRRRALSSRGFSALIDTTGHAYIY